MQARIPVVSSSSYFWKRVFSFRADSILKSDGDFISNLKFPHVSRLRPAWFPVVLGDFWYDVTCQACRENSPRTLALGSKPPLVTRIALTGLGTRLGCVHFFGAWARQAVIETIAVVYEHTKGIQEICSPIGHNNRAFAHDVTAAILVFQNNETAAMLVYQENPLGVELFSHVNNFFCSN